MNTNDSCKQQQIKISLRLWETDGQVKQYHSIKIRRIIAKVKADKFLKAFLKVSYGKEKTTSGKTEVMFNSGTYQTSKELMQALRAFLEET